MPLTKQTIDKLMSRPDINAVWQAALRQDKPRFIAALGTIAYKARNASCQSQASCWLRKEVQSIAEEG